MQDTIDSGMFKGQLQIPNHPHNMMLQLWAETGGIGAGLLALAIVLAGWRLPAPWLHGAASLKGAAIAGAMTAVACVSFDLWREWWWAVGGLLGALAVATPVRAPLGEDRMIGVPVDAPQQPAYVMWETFRPGRDGPSTSNNFNLLRLAFALMVAAFHLTLLPGLPALHAASGWLANAAEIGVQGFFVLSGYLVYASLERTPSVRLYAEKRVRRLYPAYATVIVLCTVAALLFSPAARAAPIEVARYLGWNLAFLNFGAPSLPGVFEKNPVTEINGALWTLKIEVMFYILLPALAWVLRAAGRRCWVLIGLIYVAAEAWRIGFRILGQGAGGEVFDQLYPQLPGQMSFFITGIGLRILDREGFKPTLIGAGVGLGMIVATLMYREVEFLRAAGIGLLAAWIALGIPRLFDAAKFGDLSYGVYIVHFPIIQAVVALGLFAFPFVGLGVSIAVTLTAAILLWHFVEKPSLRGDSAYRRRA
jgi:peptidoglycan/LPS O-acetylase OafA/YrhL